MLLLSYTLRIVPMQDPPVPRYAIELWVRNLEGHLVAQPILVAKYLTYTQALALIKGPVNPTWLDLIVFPPDYEPFPNPGPTGNMDMGNKEKS